MAASARNTVFLTQEESERVRKKVLERAESCRELKGKPRNVRQSKALIGEAKSASFMSDLASAPLVGTGTSSHQHDSMTVITVGYLYPPCLQSLQNLDTMKLSDLRMETHHYGKVLFLKRVAPVVILAASSWTIVQDEVDNDAERLEVVLHKSQHGEDILDMGKSYIIKEPYFTLNNDGEPTIRVDHPSDIVVSADELKSTESSGTGENGAQPDEASKLALKHKEAGNKALKRQDLLQAWQSYSEGLGLTSSETDDKTDIRKDLFRNRACVNLLMQRFDETKSDGNSALTLREDEASKALDGKAYYRAACAAYSLGEYDEAQRLFEKQLQLQPNDKDAVVNLRRIAIRRREQSTGEYNFKSMRTILPRTRWRVDAADFTGKTVVKPSPGRGRGLFANRVIAENELIMGEKAFSIAWSHEPEAWSALTCDVREEAAIRVFPAGLWKAVVQKLLDNPSQAQKVLDLHGSSDADRKEQVAGAEEHVVDSFRIHDIIARNAFDAGLAYSGAEEDVAKASTGLWIYAAYTNHSCVPNAKKEFVGDLMVMRAIAPIAMGEEISQSYDDNTDYDARAANLQKTWGFKCKCDLCVAEEADGLSLRSKRKSLELEAENLLESEVTPRTKKLLLAKARRLLRSISDTYDPERYRNLPQRASARLEQWIRLVQSR